MNESSTPVMTWDDDSLDNDQDDFLEGVEGKEPPKACSIDNPDCEACQ